MRAQWLIVSGALVASTSGYATVYLSVEQAQAVIFPGATFSAEKVMLTASQRSAIETASGVRVRSAEVRAWRVAGDGWFIVDDVLGKHEFITFALGIDSRGAVQGLEILEYRETYGGQVKNPAWRAQFNSKTSAAPLKLDQDIKNISGATLSSRHVTDGVKRLLATYELVLKTR